MGVFWNPRTGTLWAVLSDGTIVSRVPTSNLQVTAARETWDYHVQMSSRDEAVRLFESRPFVRVK
jgi:hypothetical protein